MPALSATAALPDSDVEPATMRLRGQLRYEIATAGIAHLAGWSQLAVTGPVEVPGRLGRVWFEYTATIPVGEPAAVVSTPVAAGHHAAGGLLSAPG